MRRSVPSTPCRTIFVSLSSWIRSHCVKSESATTSGTGSPVALSVAQCRMKCERCSQTIFGHVCISSNSATHSLSTSVRLGTPCHRHKALPSAEHRTLSAAFWKAANVIVLLGAGQSKQSHTALQNSTSPPHHGNFHHSTAFHHGILPHAQLGVNGWWCTADAFVAHHFFSNRCVADCFFQPQHENMGKRWCHWRTVCPHETRLSDSKRIGTCAVCLQLCLTGFVAL